jgi:ATP phosphoribosyltransferase regulatory subunit
MVHQPPAGARDLLPLDVAQKRWIENRLRSVFHAHGYHRIVTSTLERLDTLMAGGAIDASTLIQLQETDEEIPLALRPEITASIARAAVTRMAGVTYPQRLYYNANVFRRESQAPHGSQQEFYQAGVELLGAGGVLADGEVLFLLANCLQALGLTGWRLVLGEAGLTRSLLSEFPETLRPKVRSAIAHLDRVALHHLPLSDAQRERALFLFDLRGRPGDVLQRVAQLPLDAQQQQSLENLKSLVDLLAEASTGQKGASLGPDNLILDLSLIQPLDYYTGIVFEAVVARDGYAKVLGQGGRYDRLLALYHPEGEMTPGIGFALNLEDLHRVLLPTGQLPAQTPTSDWLVVPTGDRAATAAFVYARQLREGEPSTRVELQLDTAEDAQTVRQWAADRAIARIAWVEADGTAQVETVSPV